MVPPVVVVSRRGLSSSSLVWSVVSGDHGLVMVISFEERFVVEVEVDVVVVVRKVVIVVAIVVVGLPSVVGVANRSICLPSVENEALVVERLTGFCPVVVC